MKYYYGGFMRKIVRKVIVVVLTCIMLTCSVTAQVPESISPYWVHTKRVAIGHTYEYGDALCFVDIVGFSGVDSIQNVDIEFSIDIDGEWVVLASWENLSSIGNTFRFEGTVPDVELGYTYRLSFCADVHRNDTIEWLTDYYDNTY